MKNFREYINEVGKLSGKKASSSYKLTTKNKLVKLLKAENNFNLKYVESLNYMSPELYSVGNYDEMTMNTTEKTYGSFMKKAQKLLDSVENMFDEKLERTLKAKALEEELENIERSNYGKDTDAVKQLFVELAKDMTSEEIIQHPTQKIKYSVDAEESISIGGRTSSWSYTISGSTKSLGKTFKSKAITYRTETNRL